MSCPSCCNIQQDTGPTCIEKEGQLILCNELYPPNLAEIIVQFYTMTGCDSNNGFYGHGKKVSLLRDFIIDVKKELPLSDSVRKMMKTFVIQAMYWNNKSEILEKPGQLNGKHEKEINASTVS